MNEALSCELPAANAVILQHHPLDSLEIGKVTIGEADVSLVAALFSSWFPNLRYLSTDWRGDMTADDTMGWLERWTNTTMPRRWTTVTHATRVLALVRL